MRTSTFCGFAKEKRQLLTDAVWFVADSRVIVNAFILWLTWVRRVSGTSRRRIPQVSLLNPTEPKDALVHGPQADARRLLRLSHLEDDVTVTPVTTCVTSAVTPAPLSLVEEAPVPGLVRAGVGAVEDGHEVAVGAVLPRRQAGKILLCKDEKS